MQLTILPPRLLTLQCRYVVTPSCAVALTVAPRPPRSSSAKKGSDSWLPDDDEEADGEAAVPPNAASTRRSPAVHTKTREKNILRIEQYACGIRRTIYAFSPLPSGNRYLTQLSS